MKKILAVALLATSLGWGTTKYVDLSQVSDSALNNPPHYWHTGSSSDPFTFYNMRMWVGWEDGAGLYYNGATWDNITTTNDTLMIKGSIDASGFGTLNNPFMMGVSTQVFLPWNPSVNGPYRISNWGGNAKLYGTWKGGYITRSSGSFAFDGNNKSYSMLFDLPGCSIWANAKLYGCSIYAPSVYLTANSNYFENSLIHITDLESCGSGFVLNARNCAFRQTKGFWEQCGNGINDSACQYGWVGYIRVAWNAPKDSFSTSRLLVGVTQPPRPGKPSYADYATDLWGNTRYDIGANYQPSPMVSWTTPIIDSFNKAVDHAMTTLAGPVDSVKVIGTPLPAGMSMNLTTGGITGLPSKVTFKNGYLFRAYGGANTCDFVCSLSVIPRGPMRHYVNLDLDCDSAAEQSPRFKHTGESDDPLNYRCWRDLVSFYDETPDTLTTRYHDNGYHNAYSENDTFFIKGGIDYDTLNIAWSNPFLYSNFPGQTFLPWTPLVNGPWRIHKGVSNKYGVWKGGYIWNPGTLYGQFYTMVLGGSLPPGDGATSMHFMEGSEFFGSTINCNEVWFHNTSGQSIPLMVDCVMRHGETSGPAEPPWLNVDAKNTVFYMSINAINQQGVWIDSANPTWTASCQFGNQALRVPTWNAVQDSFAYTYVLDSVATPPIPGNAPYTGYATDLWGNPRYTIGANYQFEDDNFHIVSDTTINGNPLICNDSVFWDSSGVTVTISEGDTWVVGTMVGIGGTVESPDTLQGAGAGATLTSPQDTVLNVNRWRITFTNPSYLREIIGGGDNINERYLPSYDSVVLRNYFKQSAKITCNWLRVKATDTSYFNDTVIVRDSVIYDIGTKPFGLVGSVILTTPNYNCRIKLNGIRYTPRIVKRGPGTLTWN